MSNYSEKLKDPRWQKKRLLILERDAWTCQSCGDTEHTLHVHHVQYSDGDPWEIDDNFLVTLCDICHEEEPRLYRIHLDALIRALCRCRIRTAFDLSKLIEQTGPLNTAGGHCEQLGAAITGFDQSKNAADWYVDPFAEC